MNREDLGALLEGAPQAVLLVAVSGEVRWSNEAARRRGLPEAGAKLRCANVSVEEMREELARCLRSTETVPLRARMIGAAGSRAYRALGRRAGPSDDPSVALYLSEEETSSFARLTDQLSQLSHELRYRKRLEVERDAALAAERRGRAQLENLNDFTRSLASALGTEDVGAAVRDVGPPVAGGSRMGLVLLGEDGRPRMLPAPSPDEVLDASELASLAAPAGPMARVFELDTIEAVTVPRGTPEGATAAAGEQRLLVPLTDGVEPLGCLVASGVPEDRGDVLEAMAAMTSQALARTREFDREHHFNETFQRRLLPTGLPQLEGVHFAARYLPSSQRLGVGGDWYDVLHLDDRRLALVVGDVEGHDEQAAVVMSEVRNALRALIGLRLPPPDLVAELNRFTIRIGTARLVTLCYVEVDVAGRTTCTVRAGHLPPVAVSASGDCAVTQGGSDLPLGIEPDVTFSETSGSLEPGSRLVLYTDGIVERRDTQLAAALDVLAEVCGAGPSDPQGLCDHIVGEMVGGSPLEDDAAILVASFAEIGTEAGDEGATAAADSAGDGDEPTRLEDHRSGRDRSALRRASALPPGGREAERGLIA